jgi:hypothetical protein
MDFNRLHIVHYSTTYDWNELEIICNKCKESNWILVLLIPVFDLKYPTAINNCFNVLGDDLLLYEMELGMKSNLKYRAKIYTETYTNTKLWQELNT